MNNLEKMNNIIKGAEDILIVTHINPDGDAIGSSLGLYNCLLNQKKEADVLIKGAARNFDYLPNYSKIKDDESMIKVHYNTLIVLDCGEKSRVALDFDCCSFDNIIVIDHHITHVNFGNIDYVKGESPATCEMLVDILNELEYEIDANIATCLYTGLITDTGCFKYSNVNSHTFDIAKQLYETGIDIAFITRTAFDLISINKFNLLKKAISNIELIDNNIAYLYVSKEDMELAKDDENAHEGLVNYGRDIEGVEVSIMIRQIEDNKFRISLRSNEYVDVSKIAFTFGGGGHIHAAGITCEGNIEEIKENILNEIKKEI